MRMIKNVNVNLVFKKLKLKNNIIFNIIFLAIWLKKMRNWGRLVQNQGLEHSPMTLKSVSHFPDF